MSTFAVARNVLKAWVLFLGIAALLGLLGYVLGGLRLATVFGFCGLLLGLGSYWAADRAVMGMLGARELPPGEAPALHATVERLAARAGVAKPRLYLIERGPPLALAAGRGASSSAIAVTGSLAALPVPAEVEAVLAHELAHVRHRDILVQTPAVVLGALLVEASRLGGFLQRVLLFVLAPVAAAFEHLLLSPRRELDADRFAAKLCGSPHGLADALVRLEQAAELLDFRASPATEPLYTLNPFEEEGLAAMFVTHPPVGERVRRLRALDPGWQERRRAA
ncbi:MAG: protease HtpX [Thermoleophilia bacterium]